MEKKKDVTLKSMNEVDKKFKETMGKIDERIKKAIKK